MIEKDYRLVLVGNTQVGLIGLKEVFEEPIGFFREHSPDDLDTVIEFPV
jgi:hypothetical protein